MQKTARRKMSSQTFEENPRKAQFFGSQRRSVPFFSVHVIDGNESGLSSHRESDISGSKLCVDLVAEFAHGRPLRFGIRFRDSRILVNPGHVHFVKELHFTGADETGYRSGRWRFRCSGQRDVALTRQQARSRIEPDPTGAREVNLCPRMKVGEVFARTHWAFERLHVGFQLDKVTGHKSRCQAEPSEKLNKQPRRVPARPARQLECLVRSLNPGLHPDYIFDVAL